MAKKNKLLKEKRENGLKEIEKMKEKIRQIKDQHKIELMNLHSSREGSDLDTSMSTLDGYRMTERNMCTEEDLGASNDFLLE